MVDRGRSLFHLKIVYQCQNGYACVTLHGNSLSQCGVVVRSKIVTAEIRFWKLEFLTCPKSRHHLRINSLEILIFSAGVYPNLSHGALHTSFVQKCNMIIGNGGRLIAIANRPIHHYRLHCGMYPYSFVFCILLISIHRHMRKLSDVEATLELRCIHHSYRRHPLCGNAFITYFHDTPFSLGSQSVSLNYYHNSHAEMIFSILRD